jgi:hypothetical protein
MIVVPARVPNRQFGGVLLADYRSGILSYRELIVFSQATTHGMVVSHIYVDSPESMRGGRAIWGLPKELAEFEYDGRTFTARQDGATLLEARIRRRPGFLPLLIPTPITSPAGDASLGLNGRHLALAGDDLKLTMPAPLRSSERRPARRCAAGPR